MNFHKPIQAAPLLPPSVEHTSENIYAAMQKLKYPVWVTVKIDGIRALRLNGTLLSRTRKLIPNKFLRERSLVLPGGFDVELYNPDLEFCQIDSIVMSQHHKETLKIQFHVLDWFGAGERYDIRCQCIEDVMREMPSFVQWSMPTVAFDAQQLFELFIAVEQQNGEGVCFRTPGSPYKQGRSTLREQYLVKLCRFVTAEATIVGFEEQLENTNSVGYNAIGLMDRSSAQDGLVGKNTLGAFVVQDEYHTFKVGTGVGLTDALRKYIWLRRSDFLGKTITYKCKAHGRKIKPRSPIFKGFRNDV